MKNYTASVDQIIQRKIKLDRRKSALTVKAKIEKELGVIVHANTTRNRFVRWCSTKKVIQK